MSKWNFSKLLPNRAFIKRNPHLQRWGNYLHHPNLWHISRNSLAGGVAVGLFSAFIPLPIQMLLAALLALLFRVNLPVAILMTWVSNPITFVPICWVAYKAGEWITRSNGTPIIIPEFKWHTDTWQGFIHAFYSWASALGETFLIGLPIVALTISLLAYLLVHLICSIFNLLSHKK